MKTTHLQFLGIAVLAVISTIAVRGEEGRASFSLPVTQLQYLPTGVADGIHGEVKAAAAHGDSSRFFPESRGAACHEMQLAQRMHHFSEPGRKI